MTGKKPRQGAKKATDKALTPRARSKTEIKKIRAEIVESERRTLNRMGFIVEHQAQFVTNIGELKGSLSRLENIVGRLAEATLARFDEADAKHDEANEKFASLVDAQIRMEEAVKQTDGKFAVLVDAQVRTEETVKKTSEEVRSLASTVDRYLSERRNGN